MPEVTWTRTIRPKPEFYTTQAWRYDGVPYSTESFQVPAGNQKTVSYRTGRTTEGALAEGEELLASARTRGDFYKAVRDHRRHSKYDNGHPFRTEKNSPPTFDKLNIRMVGCDSSGRQYPYRGNLIPGQGVGLSWWPTITERSPSQINAEGRRAIELTTPTAPEASLAEFALEMKERIPSLVGAQTARQGFSSRSLGGEYLNWEFGLKPFVKDLEELSQSVLRANDLVNQYARDSGRVVRRSRLLSDETYLTGEATYTTALGMSRLNGVNQTSQLFVQSGNTRLHRRVDHMRVSVRFAGAFQYHLSEAHGFLGRMERYAQLANKLLGGQITASTVYELTPWSWLLDWGSDFGTFVSNVTAFSQDSLVLRYGYIMHTYQGTRIRTASGLAPVYPGGSVPASVSSQAERTVKVRTRSTPYGFGLNLENLSPRRWAILGALGMTRSPRELRHDNA